MSTHTFRAAFRPLRVAWCIRDGREDDLQRAIQLTTCLWGGRYNPIIPVGHALAHRWVDFFRADLLFPVADDPALNTFLEAFPHLRWPIFPREIFISDGQAHHPTLLDLYHPIRHIYETHIRNVAEPKVTATLFRWDPTDPLRLVLSCLAGVFPPATDSPAYAQILEKHLRARSVVIGPTDSIPTDLHSALTPATLTALDLRRHHSAAWGAGWTGPGFYLGNASDIDDIILFWNLRACDIDLTFFDPAYSTRLLAARDENLTRLRARPKDPSGWRDTIAAWTRAPHDGLPNAADFGPDISYASATDGIWNGLNLRPPLMRFPEHSVLASLGEEYGRLAATFQVPEKPFFDRSHAFSEHLALATHPLVDISLTREDVTFHAPDLLELNEFYGRHFTFLAHTARAEPDGLAQILSLTDDHTTLRAVEVRALLQQVFAIFGIAAAPSQAGLIASRLIGQMGGIEGCRVFKIAGVRSLIAAYSPHQSFTRSAALQRIGNNDPATRQPRFQEYEHLFLEPRRTPRLTPEDALRYLLAKDVFRVGLRLTCPSCLLDFWQSLDDAATYTTCEYCGGRFHVGPQLRDRDWAYRRSGLFGRDDHQEGSIPVVLTLQQLRTSLHTSGLIYSTSMTLEPTTAGIPRCETDLVVLTSNHQGRVQLVVGECKNASEITGEDVDNLRRVANAIPSERVDAFIVFAKLAAFSEGEIARCRAAQDPYRLRVIMMTARELEPYFIYQHTKEDFDIRGSAISLEDLARTTHDVFFEPKRRQPTASNSAEPGQSAPGDPS